jgi:hypothetical protein
MSRITAMCCAALIMACAPSGEQAAEDDGTAMSGGITLADAAGTWDMNTMLVGSDSVVTTSQLVATETMDGWQLLLAGRDAIPVRVVAVEGDSIVSETGQYESILRPGVMVSLRMVYRLHGEMMMGGITARYQSMDADSVVMLRTEGTRQPM